MDEPVSVLTVEYLLGRLREELDDPVLPGDGDADLEPDEDCLWKTNHLLSCLNSAQFKVARRIKPFTDQFTITLVEGQTEYPVPAWFMEARSYGRNMTKQRWVPIAGLDQGTGWYQDDYANPYWWSTYGTVSFDEKTNKVVLPREPTENDEGDLIVFNVYRFPKIVISSDSAPLELNAPKYEDALIAWARRQAYNKNDAETYDPRARDTAELDFEKAVSELYVEERIRRRRPQTVAYGGL